MVRFLPVVKSILIFIIIFLYNGCSDYKLVDRKITAAEKYETLDKRSPFLKAHMRSGEVYIISTWNVAESEKLVNGTGVLYDANRDAMKQGEFQIPIDSVVVFETNVLRNSPSVAVLAVLTGASVAVTIACLANPKACFGSCPTFYVSDGQRDILQAEGFSSSIAPWLEARDVDALFRAKPAGQHFSIEMRNEALETHVVRYVNLLAAPRVDEGRILKDAEDKFWQVSGLSTPIVCYVPEGDCLDLVSRFDGDERFSLADSSNLAEKEILELEFEKQEGKVGLVIGARQTLLSTYLLYQTFAWMGGNISDWFALFGKKQHDLSTGRLANLLGGIEIFVQDENGDWQYVGKAGEHGPLAADSYLIPLPEFTQNQANKVRLRMTKGNWRIDFLALASIEDEVEPIRILPSKITKENIPAPDVLALLLDSTKTLVTYPGDTYVLNYDIPDNSQAYDFFLESRGYYLEWMREEWMAEENPGKLARMMFTPETMLRELAPEIKKVEKEMEDIFWRSRYAKP